MMFKNKFWKTILVTSLVTMALATAMFHMWLWVGLDKKESLLALFFTGAGTYALFFFAMTGNTWANKTVSRIGVGVSIAGLVASILSLRETVSDAILFSVVTGLFLVATVLLGLLAAKDYNLPKRWVITAYLAKAFVIVGIIYLSF